MTPSERAGGTVLRVVVMVGKFSDVGGGREMPSTSSPISAMEANADAWSMCAPGEGESRSRMSPGSACAAAAAAASFDTTSSDWASPSSSARASSGEGGCLSPMWPSCSSASMPSNKGERCPCE